MERVVSAVQTGNMATLAGAVEISANDVVKGMTDQVPEEMRAVVTRIVDKQVRVFS